MGASQLASELEEFDAEKEARIVSYNVLKRYGIENKPVLGKRAAEPSHYEPLGRKAKMGERFEQHEEIFALN